MPMTEDFTVFFNVEEHGTTASYDGTDIVGVFDREYADVLGMEASAPTFTCAASDVPGVAHNDTLTIDGDVYTVRSVQPDGTGVVVLILEAP